MNPRVAALIEAAKGNQELKAALQGATTPEESVRVAKEFGLPLDLQDLAEVQPPDTSDAELEGSNAGGINSDYPSVPGFVECVTCERNHFPWLR